MSTISLWQTPDIIPVGSYAKGLKEMIIPLGGVENYIAPDSNVFIKLDFFDRDRAVSAEFLAAVCRLCRDAGAKTLQAGDDMHGEIDAPFQWEKLGYLPVAQQYDLKLIDTDFCRRVLVDCPNALYDESLSLPLDAARADVVLVVSALSRDDMLYNGAIASCFNLCENGVLMETINAPQRTQLDCVGALAPALTFIDGRFAMFGDRRQRLNATIVGSDIVAADAVGCTLTGLSPATQEVLLLAQQYGVGEGDPSQITIAGSDLAAMIPVLK